MTRSARFLLSLLQVAALLLAFAAPTLARDPEPLPPLLEYFMKSIETQVNENKTKLLPAVGRLEKTDTGYVAEEVVLAVVIEDRTVPLVRIARIAVDHPAEEDGLLTAKHMRFNDFRLEITDLTKQDSETPLFSLAMPEVILDDVSVLKAEAARNVMEKVNADNLMAGSVVIPTLEMTFRDGGRLLVTGIRGGFKGDRRTGAGHSEIDFGRVELPAEAVSMLSRKDALGGLGFARFIFTGGVVLDTGWDEKERMYINAALRAGMEGAGDLNISLTDLRIPAQVLLEAQGPGSNERIDEAFENANSPLGRMLREEVTLRGLAIGWRDKGLTEKLIAFGMKKNGLTKDQIIEAWSAYPQSFLFVLGLPQVGMQAGQALKEFLQNPESLVISMEAKAPMNFSTLMTLLEDPQGLTESLNLKVIANDGGK